MSAPTARLRFNVTRGPHQHHQHHTASSDGEQDQQPSHDLEDSIDNLSEKRASTREDALEAIIKHLRASVHSEVLENKYETILEAVKKSVRKGGEKEQRLAAVLLPLLSLTLASVAEPIYRDSLPTLTETLTNSGLARDLPEVVHAAAMSNFLAALDEPETLQQMQLFQTLYRSSRSIASSIRGWTLLATTVSSSAVVNNLVPSTLPELAQFLHSEDVDVRVAAGEALALLIEVQRHASESFELEQLSGLTDVGDMLDTLEALVSDKTKGRAKKDKVKQKLPFKDITAYITDDVQPHETLSIKNQKFEFDTWQKLVQLDALRDTLAEGFQAHFESNEFVQDILESRVIANYKKEKLNAQEKRAYMSPSSTVNKELAKNRTHQRSLRLAEKLF